MNRATFFAGVRGPLFNGRLTPSQVAGIDAILDEAEKRRTPIKWLAYMLATAYHEVDRTMQPIREYGRGRGKKYGKPTKHGGQIAYGRGLVQLTWDVNYERADKELGLNGALIRNYDLALDPKIAVQIMFVGMEKGWFTGRSLKTPATYREWRRIINGLDDATLIAGYAERFEAALRLAGYGTALATVTAPVAPAPKPAPAEAPAPAPSQPAPAPAPKPSLWSRILSNWRKQP
jgi:putative chitinase